MVLFLSYVCVYIYIRFVQKKFSHCYNKTDLHGIDVTWQPESGLECTCMNNDKFTLLVDGAADAVE